MFQQDDKMLTQENTNYIRYLLLLVQCGTEILRFLLKKALKQETITLDNLLQNAATKVNKPASKLSTSQIKLLYPQPPEIRDTKKWDISLLYFIINGFLTSALNDSEIKALNEIKDYRNDISHYPDTAMNDNEFQTKWTKLTKIICTICTDMKPLTSQRIQETFKRIETQMDFQREFLVLTNPLSGSFDNIQENIRSLEQSLQKSHAQLTVAIETGQTDTQECITDANDNVIKRIAELEKRLMKTNSDSVDFTIKAVVRALADDHNTKRRAEQSLLRAIATNVEQKVPDSDLKDVNPKVADLIKHFEKIGSKLKTFEEGSVILEFTFPSLDIMLNFVKFYYGPDMKIRLNAISQSLEAFLGKRVQLEAYLLKQPILVIEQKLRDLEQRTRVEFILSCHGVEELKRIWDIFEQGGAANTFNELSVALSDAVGKPIRLETSIDVEYLKKALQEANVQLAFNLEKLRYYYEISQESRNSKVRETKTKENATIKNRRGQWKRKTGTAPYMPPQKPV